MTASRSRPAPTLRVVPAQAANAETDGALCRAFLNGDQRAFGELVRRHQDSVFHVVRRFTANPADSFDVCQRAFLQAFEAARRALPRLERASAGDVPFRAWVLRIAINLAKNHARDARRWKLAPVEHLENSSGSSGNSSSPHSAYERAQAEQMMRKAVLELPRRQREVFSLRVDADMAFAEVAQTLGITEGNAKTHFHYAVKRLRDEVAKLSIPGGER